MALESNLNESPYFDDFDETKNFHRVLFRPGFAVQARELTQLQSILQNQVERFANEVVIDGTVISGCNITTKRVDWVRLQDRDANNRLILAEDFIQTNGKIANAIAYGTTSGMQGRVVAFKPGTELAFPSTQTLYVDYINSGSNNTTKQFTDDEVIVLRNSASNNFIVAGKTFTTNATGYGLKAATEDGIIYHKGNFIRVEPQSTIAGRYTTIPDVNVGFESRESFVNSYEDSSLYDNASGSTNAGAPGADRLRITPTLTTRNIGSSNTETFFTVAEIRDGKIAKKIKDTTYSDIGNYVDEKLFDTNGNFAVEPFNIRIREHLKSSTNLGRLTSENGGNTSLIVASVEDGMGYVGGKKIKVHAPVEISVEKGIDFDTQENGVIGQAIGNYLNCNEVSGAFDFQGLRQIKLYDTAINSVSSGNFTGSTASGTYLGNCFVRGVEYSSGVSGSASGVMRIYISGINMVSGKSFSDARALVMDSSSGQKAFADIILTNGNAVIQDQAQNVMVFPLGKGGTKTLRDSSNNIDTQFVFKNESDVNVATNGTVTVTANSAHSGGTETMNDTGNLTTPDERNIIVVATSAAETTNNTGNITNVSTSGGVATVTGTTTTFEDEYVVGDIITFNNQSATITAINTQTQLLADNSQTTLSDGSGSYTHKLSIPAGKIFDLSSRGTITSTSSSHVIDLGISTVSTFNASVQYNTLRTDAAPTAKNAEKDKFIKIDTSTHGNGANGPWHIGVPDVYKIQVFKASSGVTEASEDVTSHFYLDDGQRDSIYINASLVKRTSSSLNLSNCELLVKFSYFTADFSSGIGYFCVDSYPVNDSDAAAAGNIATYEIPVFVSPTSGKKYDLRDSIDFRPRYGTSVTPSSTVAGITASETNPGGTSTFELNSSGAYTPVPDENFQTSFQYYLSRRDRVMLNSQGQFEVSKGVPSIRPRLPEEKSASMTLATINVPPFPSLSPYVAKEVGRSDYQVKVSVEDNRRYTMKDLRVIDKRVKNVEYYSSLNALELSARNKQLFNGSGLDRFKNGFLVDNFIGHNVADTTRTGYRAAIDKKRGLMRPTFDRNYISFKKSTSGLVSSGVIDSSGNFGDKETHTLQYTEVEYISQPSASKKRNPVQELMFNWVGNVVLSPSMDNGVDVNTLPDVQVDYDGMYDSFVEIANRTGVTGTDWGAWETTNTTENENDVENDDGSRTITTTTQTDQIRDGVTTTISPAIQTFDLGTRTTNVAVRDYMRSKSIKFVGTGLRPNTKVHAYFDNELVDEYITPASSTFANTASIGNPITTDSNGNVYGVFTIPNNSEMKFRIGSREFKLVDVDDLLTESETVTTSAKTSYTSIPLDIDQQSTLMNIKVPQFTDTDVVENNTITSVNVQEIPAPPPPPSSGGGGGINLFPAIAIFAFDPIAQTFAVNAGKSDGIFLTSIDTYFARKSSTYPLTIQVREVENGIPTKRVVPFGTKTLQPAEINVDNTSATATTFNFDAPIFLKNGKDYCFVVMPAGNSDEYLIWTAELGGKDVQSNRLIDRAPASGVMLTSSNDKTWSVHQKEDIKFKLNKAKFSTGTANLYLQNKDLEFLNTTSRSGNFDIGEKVIDPITFTTTAVAGNTAGQSIGAGTTLTHSVGNFSATAKVLSVNSDNGSGAVSMKLAAQYPSRVWAHAANGNSTVAISGPFTGTATSGVFTNGTKTGFVGYEDQSNEKLHLEDSNGSWVASDIVVGKTTGAYATISSIYDMPYNAFVPKLPTITYANTNIDWTIRTTSTSGVISDTFISADNSTTSEFLDNEKKIFSRSNETGLSPRDGTNKSIIIKGSITNDDPNVSPIIDASRLNGLTIHNIINDDHTDEHKETGNANVRHISKVVELADGNEAEDLKVFVSAWRPSGTDVKVYAAIHNSEDPEGIYDKDFTPMSLAAGTLNSDPVNRNDFKELEFSFSANTQGQGFLTASSANNHARLNTSDNEVVWYMNGDGSKFRTFKNFSVKIVLTSSNSSKVPLVRDMRAIALQK